MDFYLFEVDLKSEDGTIHKESGVLYADDYSEAWRKLELFYGKENLMEISIQFHSSEGICVLSPQKDELEDEIKTLVEGNTDGRTYTVDLSNIS